MDCMKVRIKLKVGSFSRSWDNSAYVKTWGTPWMRPSKSPKVTDLGTNRKRVHEFLLIRNSNTGPISYCFGDIAGFFLYCWVTPPLFNPNFGVFPLHEMAHVGARPSSCLRLFGREIIFEVFEPVWKTYQSYRQTDRQKNWRTGGRTDRQFTLP